MVNAIAPRASSSAVLQLRIFWRAENLLNPLGGAGSNRYIQRTFVFVIIQMQGLLNAGEQCRWGLLVTPDIPTLSREDLTAFVRHS